MPETIADTRGDCVAGAGSTAAGDTTIGSITLPAGGPYKIWAVWSLIAAATATAAECRGGTFKLRARSGDMTPSPEPSNFPTGLIPSFLGATADVVSCPLKLYPVDYDASGKAIIDMIYNEPSAVTVATQVVLGVLFGTKRPEVVPYLFVDRTRAAVTAAVDTLVGTIPLPEKATKIVAIAGVIAQDGVLTAGEELIGFFRISSADVKLEPANYPFSCAYSAGLGALVNQGNMSDVIWIPVDIPVLGGATISCYCDLNTAVTNGAEVEIFLAYM